MLSFAKQRAISLGLQDVIEFKEGDAETIDLPPSAFDAALCRFGLMLFQDFKASLSNIYRSLVEGGHFAVCCLGFTRQGSFHFRTHEYRY